MRSVVLMLLICWAVVVIVMHETCRNTATYWTPPDTADLPQTAGGELILYGRELIARTAVYLGPAGKVANISNGMNCQNCHLDAGTKFMGNNYAASAANYPRFRERSGTIESLEKKINDCFIRSLNGSPLDSTSREMRAIVAYMQWLGKDVPKGFKPPGSGIKELRYLERAADTIRGRLVFERNCVQCHGSNGAGKYDSTAINYLYPPLWGPHSYNTGAGIFRLSKLAGYVKANMPFGDAHLSEEEAWDVAAFINSQPRPVKIFEGDWPVLSTKPADVATGPFPDTFSVMQHRYGPFGPIVQSRKKK
ncbi:c-type cytochrome [Chitinophaga sp. S165]|uniref:c-type cytochrome n=1 Tax=Chitinophaga sp. S165 TaxID=2135462 RepID=UPI000D719013|nr:c-type cytochrome [Chitinophaga sp. S165]PWV45890.1 thiosulfate dehydrogenase [Chitinophaga sp. S165]